MANERDFWSTASLTTTKKKKVITIKLPPNCT